MVQPAKWGDSEQTLKRAGQSDLATGLMHFDQKNHIELCWPPGSTGENRRWP